MYFDWWIQHTAFKEYLKLLRLISYNLGVATGKPASICYKHDALAFGSGIVETDASGFLKNTTFHLADRSQLSHVILGGNTELLGYKSAKAKP